MKCIVLAGGAGERLQHLSRRNCPKQFIEIENNYSIFHNTITRNISYCDEFIIATNQDCRYLGENQLEQFQGLDYRCIYEEEGKKTTAAITLACLSLEPTEYVLVTNINKLISAIAAKQNVYEGFASILVMLVKFIDAKGNLSTQVHPNDDYALEYENQYGKNEMWYVVDAKEDSALYVGFNRNVDKDEVGRSVQDNTITEVLNFYSVKSGAIFFIPAGTVHAIYEGNLICEIQQSSN